MSKNCRMLQSYLALKGLRLHIRMLCLIIGSCSTAVTYVTVTDNSFFRYMVTFNSLKQKPLYHEQTVSYETILMNLTTVLPAKSDSDIILCLQLLSKTSTCTYQCESNADMINIQVILDSKSL